MSFQKKIYILLMLFVFVVVTIVALYSNIKINNIRQSTEKNILVELQQLVKSKNIEKEQIGLTNALALANSSAVKKALKNNNRNILIQELSQLSKQYEMYTNFKNIKIHVHTKDIHSFVRSWKLDKFGDDLSSFRESIVKVHNTKKPIVGYEVGKVGLTLRAVVPVMEGNKYLGSLEFIQGLNSVQEAFKNENKEFLLLMNKEYLEIASQISDNPDVGKYKLSQKNYTESFLEDAKKLDFKTLLRDKSLKTDSYFYTYLEVKDIQDNIVGISLIGVSIKNTELLVKHELIKMME